MNHHKLPVSPATVHWGYFSKTVAPALTLRSGDRATIETLTHHAADDYERMIRGDAAAERIYPLDGDGENHRSPGRRRHERRGRRRGPGRASADRPGRGRGRRTGRRAGSADPGCAAATQFQPAVCWDARSAPTRRRHGVTTINDLIEEPKPREVVTIFELDSSGEPFAKAVYNYIWTPQTDPHGIVHARIDYPGVVVDHAKVRRREGILADIHVPARLHFGTMGLAPAEADFVSSIPPATPAAISTTGGSARADDVLSCGGAGAFFSVGDPHAAQGDSELAGTAIETSLTGVFEFVLHKQRDLGGTLLEGFEHPMLETPDQWSVYGFTFANYLASWGERAD